MEPKPGFTRNRVFGLIGVVWGGAVLLGRLSSHQQVTGSGTYATGQSTGLVFAGLLLVVGLYYLIRG